MAGVAGVAGAGGGVPSVGVGEVVSEEVVLSSTTTIRIMETGEKVIVLEKGIGKCALECMFKCTQQKCMYKLNSKYISNAVF